MDYYKRIEQLTLEASNRGFVIGRDPEMKDWFVYNDKTKHT